MLNNIHGNSVYSKQYTVYSMGIDYRCAVCVCVLKYIELFIERFFSSSANVNGVLKTCLNI